MDQYLRQSSAVPTVETKCKAVWVLNGSANEWLSKTALWATNGSAGEEEGPCYIGAQFPAKGSWVCHRIQQLDLLTYIVFTHQDRLLITKCKISNSTKRNKMKYYNKNQQLKNQCAQISDLNQVKEVLAKHFWYCKSCTIQGEKENWVIILLKHKLQSCFWCIDRKSAQESAHVLPSPEAVHASLGTTVQTPQCWQTEKESDKNSQDKGVVLAFWFILTASLICSHYCLCPFHTIQDLN